MSATDRSQDKSVFESLKLRKLTVEQVRYIDEVLSSPGEYGEVHLIVQHGELRSVNKVESVKVWKNETKK